MKTISTALANLLNSNNQVFIADLLTITTLNNTYYRYTNADVPIIWGGYTYVANDIIFSRGSIRTLVGIEVDHVEIDVYASENNLMLGIPFFQTLANGGLDGARVVLQRAYTSSLSAPIVGTLISFSGRLSDVQLGRTSAKITVKSDIELLNIQVPTNLYQTGCTHTLYDAGCTLLSANFGIVGAVTSSSSTSIINTNLVQGNNYFDLGKIIFSSGANVDVSRGVKNYASGVVNLVYPYSKAPAVGDVFTIYPGCDKLQSTCTNKFNNVINFKGMPYVPVPETAM